jgi:hypothetical protein
MIIIEARICENCGSEYLRPAGYSARQWVLRRFCNHKCQAEFQREDVSVRFERFFRRGEPNECWEWSGGRHGKGYGQFGNPTTKAHRVAWELYRGPVPDGLHVLHSCDNPPCVNPNHLFLGTNLDNVNDKVAKGRAKSLRGEASPSAQISEVIARKIRADPRTQGVIAAEYGLAQTTVSAIKRRIIWGWLE